MVQYDQHEQITEEQVGATFETLSVAEAQRRTQRKRAERPSDEELRSAREEGLTIEQMCAKWGGVAQSTVSRWIQRAGLSGSGVHRQGQQEMPEQSSSAQVPLGIEGALVSVGDQRATLVAIVERCKVELSAAETALTEFDEKVFEILKKMGISIPTTTE